MGASPISGRPLPLGHDPLDDGEGVLRAGDGDQVGPPERGLVRLVERRADEQPLLAQPCSKSLQSGGDGAVEMALGGEVLPARQQLAGRHGGDDGTHGFEARRVRELDTLGSRLFLKSACPTVERTRS